MRSLLTAGAVGIVAAVCASSAAGQSPPPVPLAFSGEIQFNKALQKETFNDVSTIDVMIPPGNGSTLVITYSVPVQGNVTDACQILSQTLLDDNPTSIQQVDQLGHSGTITVRTTQVVPLVSPGLHHVSFRVYPVCDGLMAAHTVWDHGVWGGFYNYVVIER